MALFLFWYKGDAHSSFGPSIWTHVAVGVLESCAISNLHVNLPSKYLLPVTQFIIATLIERNMRKNNL